MTRADIQGMQAEANTVAAFERVNARFGGRLRITSPYGAGRSHQQQAHLHQLWLDHKGNYAAPAGQSNHEFDVTGGTALDISNWASFSTLRAAMAAEGFTRDPSEGWHYNFRGTTTAGGGATPISTTTEQERRLHHGRRKNMLPLMIVDGKGKFGPAGATRTYLFGPGLWRETTGEGAANHVSLILVGLDRSGDYFGTPNLSYAELYAYARDSGALTEAQLAPYKAAAG